VGGVTETLNCPKCGREVAAAAVICGGCDFILDASFLGDDIMDAEADKRVKREEEERAAAKAKGKGKAKPKAKAKAKADAKSAPSDAGADDGDDYGADALIIGDLDDEEVKSFDASDTGLAAREVTHARVYVGASIQAILMDDAIPAVAPDLAMKSLNMTPFERHVLEYVNGKRPVARIRKKSQLNEEDFQTALALLADKGFIELKGHAKKTRKKGKKSGKRGAPPLPAMEPDPAESTSHSLKGTMERTLIADAPSARDLDLDEDKGLAAEAEGFDEGNTGALTAPEKEDIHREVTMIQKGPPPSDDDDEGGVFDSIEETNTAFADSLLSEENVFASAEEMLLKDVPTSTRSTPRAPRRPPLPGEGSSDAAAPPVAKAPPPIPHDASIEGADFDIEPQETHQELRAIPSSEQQVPPDPYDDADSFDQLPTDVPDKPVSVQAGDISLISIDPAEMDFSEEASGPTAPAPNLGEPPSTHALKGVTPTPTPPTPAPPTPAPPTPAPPTPAAADESEEDEPVDDSVSEEEPAGPEVPFEMRRKADKIFEQAQKDYAAGNVSSALMNAKLAKNFNPSEKRYKLFIEEWEEEAKLQKKQRRAHDMRVVDQATEAENRGDYEKAAELLMRAIELAPKAAALHNRLGVLLATRLKRYKDASNYVLRAIELNPKNLAYKNNLGKILAKEESALHKMPIKKRRGKKDDENQVIIGKMRPQKF
jgi:tetratricopeptide (TPR) repeat protein